LQNAPKNRKLPQPVLTKSKREKEESPQKDGIAATYSHGGKKREASQKIES
jgi:hypothetical protein